MKTLLAAAFAVTLCLVAAGCASRGASSTDGGSSAAGSSGITVFGTIDANVSNVRNQSR